MFYFKKKKIIIIIDNTYIYTHSIMVLFIIIDYIYTQ